MKVPAAMKLLAAIALRYHVFMENEETRNSAQPEELPMLDEFSADELLDTSENDTPDSPWEPAENEEIELDESFVIDADPLPEEISPENAQSENAKPGNAKPEDVQAIADPDEYRLAPDWSPFSEQRSQDHQFVEPPADDDDSLQVSEPELVVRPSENRPVPRTPLPDKVRKEIQRRINRRKTHQLSIAQVIGLTTLVAAILGAAAILPISLYMLLMGLGTFVLLFVIHRKKDAGILLWFCLAILFVLYVGGLVRCLNVKKEDNTYQFETEMFCQCLDQSTVVL
jgi:hypothetical protein